MKDTSTLVEPFTKKSLSKLYVRLMDFYDGSYITKKEGSIFEEYLQAVRTIDRHKLLFFSTFGPSIRHQILNIVGYRHGLQFGFVKVVLNDCNWLDNAEWKTEETIEARVAADKNKSCNEVRIAKGPNGKWTYGISYKVFNGGGGGDPSVFGKVLASREEAIAQGLDELEGQISRTHSIEPHPYQAAVLKRISEVKKSVGNFQLQMF